MGFLKKNIFGILAIIIGIVLLINSILDIDEIQNFNEFIKVGEYISAEKNVVPNLMTGILKMSLWFLLFLLVPVVLSIVHKRRQANNKILYVAIVFVLANFLVFPYLLTLFYNSTQSI
ncbi:hypothetical protein [Psychroserpens sp. Hel_I_66]|uniref:hypothetical protein n=1 Tax=Psychroserpens sp. Hel_I_66 TaxID=1250004 RepID=UPI000645E638|nr:hypothetical protein [Psychroserpens sp. Hel_I_66]